MRSALRLRLRPRHAVRAGAAALVVSLAGCGGEAGDLLALEVSGGLEPEPVRLTVTDDGRGSCGEDELRAIPNERLIEARAVERDLEGPAEAGASFAEAAEDRRRRYVARTQAGTVRWTEGAPGLPDVLPRAALLAQELRDELCDDR